MTKKLTLALFISAILISISAEFFSIYGLSKVFSGEALYVIILTSVLGLSKLTMVGFLHEYWDRFSEGFWRITKFLFIGFVCILTIVTSAGVYGFLSSAYQVTADKDKINTERIKLLEKKRDRFSIQLTDLKSERDQINQNIQNLSKSLSTDNQYQTIDRRTGQVLTQIQKTSKKGVETQLNSENDRRNSITSRIDNISDSIQNYEVLIIEANQNNSAGSELGTLRYISNLINVPMDKVVNIFILLLTLVTDPLAIFLLVAALYSAKNGIQQVEKEKVQTLTIPENPEQIQIQPTIPIERAENEPKFKRKRGRPRKTQTIISDAIIPDVEKSMDENQEKKDLLRTVIENDLSSEVMRHLTDSLPKKKIGRR